MAKWNLISNKEKVGNETVYHYKCEGSNSNGIKFHMHPTEAFAFVILEGSKNVAEYLTEAFVEAAFTAHKTPGGFSEAIKVLEV